MILDAQLEGQGGTGDIPRGGSSSRWAIVLAEGTGPRMSQPAERWWGEDCPSQYHVFADSRTPLRRTIDRVSNLIPPERILIVVHKNQRKYLEESVAHRSIGTVIEQPSDRGTMAAIFAAAARVLLQDSSATLLVSLSDQYEASEKPCVESIKHGLRLAESYGDLAFLLGVKAGRAETDYGWIVPGEKLNLWDQRCPLPIPLTIKRFREKPSPKEAENLFRSGCLWNTFFMATKAMNLWTLGWRVLPKVMGHFDDHLRTLSDICEYNLGSSHEAMALQRLYNRINVIDFSKNVLEKAHKWCSVLPVDQLGWSDWGAPKRMKESLRQGNASVIPMECVRTLRRESE